MDTDWTFSSCSWLWEEDITFKNSCCDSYWTREEDKVFEDAIAMYHNDADRWDKIAAAVPGKTIEDLKLHYEALRADVLDIESDKVPLPHYPTNASVRRKRKKRSYSSGAKRGVPWTEDEHRRFLQGLQQYGRGDWKSISRNCVWSKSNSQVASHAQKYFKRLNSADKEGKRPSINDIHTVHPGDSISPMEKPPAMGKMPAFSNKASTSTEKKQMLPTATFSSVMGSSSHPPFISQPMMVDAGPSSAPAGYSMFNPPFSTMVPVRSMEMPMYQQQQTAPVMQGSEMPSYGSFDVPSTTEFMDVGMFVLPHFLE